VGVRAYLALRGSCGAGSLPSGAGSTGLGILVIIGAGAALEVFVCFDAPAHADGGPLRQAVSRLVCRRTMSPDGFAGAPGRRRGMVGAGRSEGRYSRARGPCSQSSIENSEESRSASDRVAFEILWRKQRGTWRRA